MPDPTTFAADHLLLIVGFNPLPNVVAGRLLVEKGGHVTLLYTRQSAAVCEELLGYLTHHLPPAGLPPTPRVHKREISKAAPRRIYTEVYAALNKFPNAAKVGLHYTGGAKAMSVHAYGAIRTWAANRGKEAKDVICTYLDAEDLRVWKDPVDPSTGDESEGWSVGNRLAVPFNDLTNLHGWERKTGWFAHPPLIDAARALVGPAGVEWARHKLHADWKKKLGEKMKGRPEDVERRKEVALKPQVVPLSTVQRLAPFNEALRRGLGFTGDSFVLGDAFGSRTVGPERFNTATELARWLDGSWLESLTLQAFLDIQNDSGLLEGGGLPLHDLAMSTELHPPRMEEPRFELDVLAMRGYQLFVCSCSADANVGALKHKAFEARERARQIGGEEARVALVCPTENSDDVESQFRRLAYGPVGAHPGASQSSGPVKVFGRKHLPHLAEHVKEWILDRSGTP